MPQANAPRRKEEIPSGLALSADGTRLYVCGNLSNQLLELDAASGKVLRTFPVGVAPYDVLLTGGKAYVSNWGGRRPGDGDLTGPAGRGTLVRVDPEKLIASEGSVSIVPLSSNDGGAMAWLHAHGEVMEQHQDGLETRIEVRLSEADWARFTARQAAADLG